MGYGVVLLLIGLIAGIASGALGIGGAILIIPALVYFVGMDQKTAQGTTLLLMLPPIGILAAWEYYRQGHADWRAALFIAAGFLIGGYLGALGVAKVPPLMLKRTFGLLLLAMGLKMVFKP